MAPYFPSWSLPDIFRTSSMSKRLLQFAFSKLDIFDADALDLENLDVAFGKNSTFEFRDVGLRLRKLENILQLPPSFELVKARVLLLRLTLPVNVFNDPIIVEVDGVEGQLRVKPKPEKSTTSRTNQDRKGKRPRSRSFGNKNRTRVHSGRRGSDYAEDDSDAAIPTAADLAESFLQTESEKERAELEAAILSETQELGTAASVMSDDGDLPVGTGAPLSLPAFLTNLVQGIIDRLQVKIHGITINMDLEVPNENSRPSPTNPTDPVTVQLRIDNVDVEGVTQELQESTVLDDDKPKSVYKEGKRLVSLSNIRGALISEANLFSSLGRSSALSSSSAVHSDVSEDRRSAFRPTISRESTSRTFDGAASDRGSITSSRRLSTASLPRNLIDSRSLAVSMVASDSGRFDDASEDGDGSHMSESLRSGLSHAGDSIYQNSAYLDQLTESQYLDEEERRERESHHMPYSRDLQASIRGTSPLSTPRASMHLPPLQPRPANPHVANEPVSTLQSTMLPARPHSRFSEERVSQSQPSLPPGLRRRSSQVDEAASDNLPENASHTSTRASESDDEDGASTPIGEQDLAQSQLFSHEDAESMYMSAISHASSTGKVPGAWESSHSGGTDDSSSPPPVAVPKVEEESRDNLEHALHSSPVQTTADLRSMEQSSSSIAESLRVSRASSSSSSSPSLSYKQPSPPMPQMSSTASERSTTSSDEYSRLSKQVFSLDRVDIYIPSSKPSEISSPEDLIQSTFDGPSEASRSTSVNVPGAFSTHLPRKNSPSEARPIPVAKPVMISEKGSKDDDKAIEVQIGKLSTQFDVSMGRLIFKLVQQLQEALKRDTVTSANKKPDSAPSALDLELNIGDISVVFLERLEGTLGSARAPSDRVPFAGPQDNEVLLRTTVQGLNVHTLASSSTTKTTITMKKFVFGYAQESIVSFDAGLQMRASVRDLKASDGIDVRVNISTAQEVTRCEVITLPMHVSIDLQRLDETFSWFGGLSSVLNMGSSIASNATVTATTSPSKPKPRGVRFETPIKPDDKSLVAQNKADVRIGGFVLDLVGAECSIGVETSAVKIVNRDEGIGVFVQAIRLSGPHLKYSNDEPAIVADINSTRIEYLPSPKDADLSRLLDLITPSKSKYDEDDDILLDTLMRQRRQGPVLRLTVDDLNLRMAKLEELSYLPDLGEEVARLATVAKYLPDDERPGLLSLITVHKFDAHVDVNNTVGTMHLSSSDIEVAQITLPSLIASRVKTISLRRNVSEEIIGPATDADLRQPSARSPAIMARMIGDEMEPVVKIKLWNIKVEYKVPTMLALLGLMDSASPKDMSASLVGSVATLTEFARSKAPQPTSLQPSTSSPSKPLAVDVVMRECIVGLNPLGLPSKLLVVLTEAHLNAVLPKEQNTSASLELNKASLLIIDNVAHLSSADVTSRPRRQSFDGGSSQIADLCAMGFVSVSYISSAKVAVQVTVSEDAEHSIDVELRDDLFVLETCADSTQTLIAILSGLTPPSVPSKETKYRTKVIPVHDLLASLTGDAFGTAEGDYNFDDDFGMGEASEAFGAEGPDDLDFDSHFYQQEGDEDYNEAILEDEGGLSASAQLSSRDTHDGVLLDSFVEPEPEEEVGELDFQDNHFGTGSVLEGTAHRWNSTKNTYDHSNASKVRKSPLKACVRDMHIIWNLFDGYDWQNTRDTITKAVQDVESRAIEKKARNDRRSTFDHDIDDEDEFIGDFLFNSIYIGIPGNKDPRELAAAINQELNDNATETESIATTYLSSSTSRQGSARKSKPKKLRLNRSKRHKITFELKGVSVDLVTFPPDSGETQSSVDVRVHDFDIFDHVPTSTWRKFATYMQDAGEREFGTSMIHLEILNVKPIADLAASEIVLKATILPLRLHVDQDALDFIIRFFEFKEDSATPSSSSPSDVPFIQRAEINTVKVKLDFKPKRVDYAGLRSGHTTELMNFIILDEAPMELRRAIIYGVSGFDKLGKTLNDIWMPDIKNNQLAGILGGLAPVRSLVNVGGGFRHLVTVPIREYKKDGRIVRGISKGASAFARSTGTELVKLGAKVAIGVQTVLQGAEGFLGPTMETTQTAFEEEDLEEETKKISLYANQPVGVLQGLRGGYAGLQRDLLTARDAFIAVPGEVMESGNAAGVFRAVRKHAPTVILRPAIGVAKAGGQILMGATNSLDPVNLQRAEDKYKRH